MKAVVWHGKRDVRTETVPDPVLKEPNDAIIRVTSSGLCGSDLHLYELLGPFMSEGDVLGHEPMGIVEEVGREVSGLAPGDRVVVPFNISCGHCWMCSRGLHSQCETTQVREEGKGAALFGYSKLYGSVAGGQAEYLRVPEAQFGPIKVPEGPADDRFVYLSDVLPTAWQAVEYAGVGPGDSLVILGLGPIGEMSGRVAQQRGVETVIGVDLVPERLDRARAHGIDALRLEDHLLDTIRDRTNGRGPDAVIDAVGMEAHGAPVGKLAQQMTTLLPKAMAAKMMEKAGLDRLASLHLSMEIVRRGGTVSIIGVYGGMADPMPMMSMFDKQIQLRMGQANVRRWVDDIMPLLVDEGDPLGVDDFATHRLPLDAASSAYADFQTKADGMIKVLFQP
jgi:threonine dehydrogenase-like Zn-dependent dehydrogenase